MSRGGAGWTRPSHKKAVFRPAGKGGTRSESKQGILSPTVPAPHKAGSITRPPSAVAPPWPPAAASSRGAGGPQVSERRSLHGRSPLPGAPSLIEQWDLPPSGSRLTLEPLNHRTPTRKGRQALSKRLLRACRTPAPLCHAPAGSSRPTPKRPEQDQIGRGISVALAPPTA